MSVQDDPLVVAWARQNSFLHVTIPTLHGHKFSCWKLMPSFETPSGSEVVPGNVPLIPTLLSLRGCEMGIRNPVGNLPEEKVPFAMAHVPSVQGGVDKWATSHEPATGK